MNRGRLLRILRRIALILGALTLLMTLALFFLLNTQTGTRFLFARLGALLPGSFAVQQANGRIDSPLTLLGVTYKKPGMEVTIDRLYLEWKLSALLDQRVDIGKLYADGIHVVSTPQPSTEPTKLPDLDLHFNIIVRDARVRGLTLGSTAPGPAQAAAAVTGKPPVVAAAGAPAATAAATTAAAATAASAAVAAPTVIDEIDLRTSDISNQVRIDDLAVRSALLTADVTGTVQPIGDYPVDLKLRWTVRPPAQPGQPATSPIVGSGALQGTLAALHVDQVLTAPFDVRLAATLTQPLRDLSFDGKVTFNNVNPRRLRSDLPDLPATGILAARGNLEAFTSTGSVQGAMAPAGAFRVDYDIQRQGDTWQIRQATVALPGTPTHLALSGRVALPPASASGAASGGNARAGGASGASTGAGGGLEGADNAGSGASSIGGAGGAGNASGASQAAPIAADLDADIQASWTNLAWPPRTASPSFASPRGSAHIIAHARGPAAPGGNTAAGAASATASRGAGAAAAPAPAPQGKLSSEGSIEAVIATIGALKANYKLHRDGGDWRLDALDLDVPGTPTHVAASGRVGQRAGGAIDLDAALNWRALRWPLTGPPQVTSAAGQARIAGGLDSFRARLSADLAPGPAAAGPAPALPAGTPGVTQAAALPPAAASANAASSASPAMASGNGTNAATPAKPAAAVPAAAGANAGATIPRSHVDLAGNGGRDHFHIDSLTANLLSGRLQGRGDVAWSPRLRWNVTLAASGINPAAVRPDFPGSLAFNLSTHGESGPSGLTGAVDLPNLQGTLRGQPVAVAAAVGLAGAEYDIANLDARWGTAHVSAKGRAGERLDLTFNAEAPNLGLLQPGTTGSLKAQGHVAGPLKTPHIQATVEAQGLRQGTQSVGSANVRADVDLAAAGPFTLDATLKQINAGGQLISQVVLASRGTTASHTLTVNASGLGGASGPQETSVALGLSGGLSGGPIGASSTWRGQITRLDLRSSPAGDWSLTGPASLSASAAAVDLRDFCWSTQANGAGAGSATGTDKTGGKAKGGGAGAGSGPAKKGDAGAAQQAAAHDAAAAHPGGHLCASAAWSQAGTWAGELTLADLPLTLAQPFLPVDSTISGTINGSAKAHGGSHGIAAADVDITPGPGDLRFPAENGRSVTVHFERSSIKAQAGPSGGDATVTLTLKDIGAFDAHVKLPRLTQGIVLAQQPLSGTVAAHLHSLSFIEGFVPELRDVTGSLNADLTLSGTAAAPRVSGQAKVDGASAKAPQYGLDLKNIQLTATGNGGTTLAVNATASSNPGKLQVTGTAGLMPSAAEPVHLKVSGTRFAVMNTRDIRILVSPDLELTYEGTRASVTGDLTVPEARLHVQSAPKSGPLQPSKDVVFVGPVKPAVQQAAPPPLALHVRVRLVLPNPSVEVDALGLKAQPYGSLLLVEAPGRPTSGTGELDLRQGGTFQAYGQNLTIQTGRLVFGGPLDDPGLDIRASRLSDDQTVTAGIQAKGTLKQPQFSVWSNPTMGESDALAYLVLGHGLNSANAQEGNRVANAATSLGLSGAGMLANNIAQRFGLEEATVESSGSLNQASLVLGKFLAPHLYVLYGIGLFQPINTFRVRYIISSKWTLQAEESTETGADILYTLERGHTK